MVKKCPQCELEIDANSQCCECGYLFVNELIVSQANDRVQVLRIQRKSSIGKVVVITAALVLSVVAFVLYIGGFLNSSEYDVAQDKPATLVQSDPANANTAESAPTDVPSDEKSYKVTKVYTGDIIDIADDTDKEYRISLFGIRAPKLNEDFGTESKQNLSNLILGKTVFIRTRKSENEPNFVAEVISGNTNASIAQLQSGLVWPLSDQLSALSENLRRQYYDAELSAKSKKNGLWFGSEDAFPTGEVAETATYPSGSAEVYAKGNGVPPVVLYPAAPVRPQTDGPKRDESTVGSTRVAEGPKQEQTVAGSQQPAVKTQLPKSVEQPTRSTPAEVVKTESSGPTYTRGPRGGCFYINSKGSKVYVDRSVCN
jgi:endonuclease YncB( thermonuclease family)